MGARREHLRRAFSEQGLRGLHQRSRRINDVVNHQRAAPAHIADQVHHFADIHVHAALIHDRQRRIQLLRKKPRPLHTARIRRDHSKIRQIQVPEVFHQHWRAIQVIHGHVEITLDLRRMQVQCQRPARTRGFQQVRHELRGDGNSWLVFAVLPRIAVIRQNCSNAPGRRALERVDHQQQFHQVAVHGSMARLHDKHIGTANIFQNLEINFAVAEAPEQRLAQRHVQVAADALRQYRIRGP